MTKTIIVQNRTITLYSPNQVSSAKALPVVYYNAPGGDGRDLWYACQKKGCAQFNLVVISNLDWDGDMSPWPAPKLNALDRACSGQANTYLEQLCRIIIPAAERQLPQPVLYRILAGYSLSGLFALYAFYHTRQFAAMVSCSGSFWYPDFIDYVKNRQLARVPAAMYFSLGNTEARTSNPRLQDVQVNTEALVKYYKHQHIDTTFVLNTGNHFQDPYGRLSKGIQWTLRQLKEERNKCRSRLLPVPMPDHDKDDGSAADEVHAADPPNDSIPDPAHDTTHSSVHDQDSLSDPAKINIHDRDNVSDCVKTNVHDRDNVSDSANNNTHDRNCIPESAHTRPESNPEDEPAFFHGVPKPC